MRLALGTGVVAAIACATAAAGTVADWSIAIGAPATTPRVGRPFALMLDVRPADGTTDSYNVDLTLTPSSSAVRVVSWSSVAGIRCSRAGRGVACVQRSIGGEPPFSTLTAVFVLRAAKPGRYSVAASITVTGDTNAANDRVRRVFTVKPAKR